MLGLKRRQTRIMINEGHKNVKLAFEQSQIRDIEEKQMFKEKKEQNLLNIMNRTMQLQKQRNKRMTVAGKSIEESMIQWTKISDEEYAQLHGEANLILSQKYDKEAKLDQKCCKKKSSAITNDDDYTVEEVEEMDQHLFTRLILEKKALWNWRKLMTMI